LVSFPADYGQSEVDFKKQKIPSSKRGRFYAVKAGVCCLGLVFKMVIDNTPLAPLDRGEVLILCRVPF